jgi:hypothetical protein
MQSIIVSGNKERIRTNELGDAKLKYIKLSDSIFSRTAGNMEFGIIDELSFYRQKQKVTK